MICFDFHLLQSFRSISQHSYLLIASFDSKNLGRKLSKREINHPHVQGNIKMTLKGLYYKPQRLPVNK